MQTRCCYKGCGRSRYKNKGVRLFRFPLKNADVWIKNCGNPELIENFKQCLVKRSLSICEQHFRPEDFLPSGRIKHGAVPLPCEEEQTDEQERKSQEGEEKPVDLEVFKEIYRNVDVYNNPNLSRSYGEKPCASVNVGSVTISECGSSSGWPSRSQVDSDISSQLNYSSMAKYMKRARESSKPSEEEPQGSPGTSNIESVPCASTSNIQFKASEITSLQDPDFGTLEESGMGQFVQPLLVEETSNQDQDVAIGNEEDTVASTTATTSTNTTNTTATNTDVNDDVITTKSTYAKSTSRQQKSANTQDGSEAERLIKSMISQKKLDYVIDKLESVSKKLSSAMIVDQYDQFGKYVGSLLRGMPIKKVNYLKKKILEDVLTAVEGKDSNSKFLKSTGTQVGFDVLASEKSYKKFINEQSQAMSVSKDLTSLGNNIPILGGTLPLIFPAASTPTASFQLLPVIPMSPATSMVSSATMVTPSLLGSITSVHSVPMPPSEAVTTVAKSVDGTLLAVTIPKPPKMSETPVGSEQSSLQSPRGQKRKQTTAAYLIKKTPSSSGTSTHTVAKSGEDSNLDSQTINHTEDGRQTVGPSQSKEDSRDSGGGEVIICSTQPKSQSVELSHSQENSRDSGGEGGVSNCSPCHTANDVEYEMDIEEGNELLRIKQDTDLFETVICDESSSFHFKEEAPDPDPDPDETLEDELITPTNTVTPSATFNCPLCTTQCNNRDDLDKHISTLHPGDIPPSKDVSGGSYFLT